MSEYFRKPIVKTLMLKGQEGQSIKGIKKTGTSGLVDTYTITLTDGTTSTFSVENGKGISSISKTGTSGLVDTYTITYNDGATSTFKVTNGEGLQNLQVGGRNYLLGSDIELTGDGAKAVAGIDTSFVNRNLGKQVTLSFRYTAENWAGSRFGFQMSFVYDDGFEEYYNTWIYGSANGYATSRTIIRFPTTHGKVKRIGDRALYVQGTTAGTVTVYNPKLELGNIVTDWTPAPEDMKLESYPVGSIYTSTNSTSPASLFGGTWEQLKDRFMLAAGDTYSAGSTGGEATHTLTVDEMPSHYHAAGTGIQFITSGEHGVWDIATGSTRNYRAADTTASTGGSKPHNNMPPYLAVYAWKRIA